MTPNAIGLATVATVLALGLVRGDPGRPRPGSFTRVQTGAGPVATTSPVPAEWRAPTSATTITGDLSYYAAGLMDRVAANRGLGLEGYAGGVVLMRRGDLGRVVWIRMAGSPGPWAGPFLVVDCANRAHYAGLVRRGRAAEVSRAMWLKWGLPEDLVPVVVTFEDPTGATGR